MGLCFAHLRVLIESHVLGRWLDSRAPHRAPRPPESKASNRVNFKLIQYSFVISTFIFAIEVCSKHISSRDLLVTPCLRLIDTVPFLDFRSQCPINDHSVEQDLHRNRFDHLSTMRPTDDPVACVNCGLFDATRPRLRPRADASANSTDVFKCFA